MPFNTGSLLKTSELKKRGWRKSSGRHELTLTPVPMRVATVLLRTDGENLQDVIRKNLVLVKKKKQGVVQRQPPCPAATTTLAGF